MFNNPLRKHQSGGTVATPQQQQQIAKLFEAASKNTGIDVETLMSAANELKDEDSMKQYVEAISLAAQGDQTAITAIKKMFSQQSPVAFAKGGKLWNFICKHAKGGHLADCGCKEDGGNLPIGKDANSARRLASKNTIKVGDNGKAKNRSVGAALDNNGGKHVFEGSTINNSWAQSWASVPQPGDTTVIQKYPVAGGNETANIIYPQGTVEYESVMSRLRPVFKTAFPQYEEGGNIEKDQDGNKISRKEALQAAQERRGFSKEQAQRAYANAKYGLRNAGLRGNELRQAARKLLVGPMEQEAVESIPTAPIAAPQVTITAPTIGLAGSRPVRTNNYDNMSFSNAFRAAANIADKGGDKTFSWKGKTYGTRRDANWRERWGKESTKTPIVPDINTVETPNGTIELPVFEEIPVNTLHVEQIPLSAAYPFHMLDSAQTFIDPAFYGSDLMSSGFNDSYHRVYNPGAKGRVIREHTSAIASRPYVGQKMTLSNTGETTPNGEIKLPRLVLPWAIPEEEIEVPEYDRFGAPIFEHLDTTLPFEESFFYDLPTLKKENGGIIKGQRGIGKAGKAIMKSTSKARIPSSTATLGKNLGQSVRNIAKPSKVDYDIDKIFSTVDNNTYIEPFEFTFPKFENNIEPIDFSKYSAKDLMHNPPTLTDQFINWAKGRYTPKSESDWAKYKLGVGIGAAAGAAGASILAKNSQNK